MNDLDLNCLEPNYACDMNITADWCTHSFIHNFGTQAVASPLAAEAIPMNSRNRGIWMVLGSNWDPIIGANATFFLVDNTGSYRKGHCAECDISCRGST